MLRYGPEIAIRRILETCRRVSDRQTFFIPGWCKENYPAAIKAIVAGGHEIGYHGCLHEHPNKLAPAEEAYWLDRALTALEKTDGGLVDLPSYWGLDDWPQYVQSMEIGHMMRSGHRASGCRPLPKNWNRRACRSPLEVGHCIG